MQAKVHILGFGGSLRKGSFNESILQTSIILNTALATCPEEGEVELFEKIGEFPLYNEDLEPDMPAAVQEFKRRIEHADAILIATPEYDYSVPGYLKNAIDWGSRPYGKNSFEDKPCAILSASPSLLGGVKAQYALRQAAVALNLHVINRPEVLIPAVTEKIEDGKLTDEVAIQRVKELLVALCAWTVRLNSKSF